MEKRSTIVRILALFNSRKREVVILLALIALTAIFNLAVPLISQRLLDTLVSYFKGTKVSPLHILALSVMGILFATILARVAKSIYDYRLYKVTTEIEDEVKFTAYDKYLHLHALFHHGASSGQMIGRIERGATGIFNIIYDIIGHNFAEPLITFLGAISLLLYKNWIMAAAVFIPFPVFILAIRKYSSRIYDVEQKASEAYENVSREEYDVAGNIHTVKKFAQEQVETAKQIKLQKIARLIDYSGERLWAIMDNLQTLIGTVGRISVIILGGLLVLSNRASIGEYVLYISLHSMAYGPLERLSYVFPRLRRNIARSERLFMVLDEPIKILDKENALVLPLFSQEIIYENVGFKYAEKDNWALRGASVKVAAGQTVALVGRSGSGKTTFINLLLRSFDPQEGRVLIDGHDIREVTQKSLRDQIAVVPQEVDLFSRTIKENIAYGHEDASQEEIENAAKSALAHDFISKMEYGYDTVVGERGIKLSGGERQRVGIARAVLRDPRILILDEATSHLDSESEKIIQKATAELAKNKTSFIIAHRLSTILHADMIIVFSRGAIEAIGQHRELMKTSPTYEKLYSLQFGQSTQK